MLDEILESATAVTSDSEDYRGEDGLLYCGKCHTPREAYFPKGITLLGKNRHPIECVCRRMERERQEAFFIEQKHLGLVQRLDFWIYLSRIGRLKMMPVVTHR